MKKNPFAFLTGLALLLALTVNASGQFSIGKLEASKGNVFDEMLSETSLTDAIDPATVAPKVIKDFARNFKNANEKWFKVEGAFVARFTQNDIIFQLGYDKRGTRMYTIRTYGENKLPEDIRRMVKSTYYDYTITLVQEVEVPHSPMVYVVHLDGKTELINLRISDGDMDEWQKFKKSE